MRRHILKLSYIQTVLYVALFASGAMPQDVIRVETNLVQVPVVVLDRDGRYLPDLVKEDFTVFEEDKPQHIERFTEVDEPVTVYLMLDTSGSMARFMKDLARSAGVFINQLRPDDHLILGIFADSQAMLVKNEKISKLLEENRTIAIRPLQSQATYVYDAVEDAINYMAAIKGRKAIVLFTDALSENRMASARENFRDAEEQDALIYTVRYGDLTLRPDWVAARETQRTKHYTPLDQTEVRDIVPSWDIAATGNGKLTVKELEAKTKRVKGYMDSLAAKTGGRSFEIDKIENLSEVFRHITLELRRTYTLSYYSNSDSGPERRKLEVKVNIPDAVVRAKREIVIHQAKPVQTH
ncbi:MAG: VWA domain-containing protein [Pyrinomonadaceae bacterium]|nr:VWA domain-containing protein [Pyrinomonadaceae bacterium]